MTRFTRWLTMIRNTPSSQKEPLEQFEPWLLPALLSCLRHPLLLLFGLLVGLGLGQLYARTKHPAYQSSAQVLVLHKQPDAPLNAGLDHGGSQGFEDYLATHQGLIHSPMVVD